MDSRTWTQPSHCQHHHGAGERKAKDLREPDESWAVVTELHSKYHNMHVYQINWVLNHGNSL